MASSTVAPTPGHTHTGGSGSGLSKKLGPLPVWAWALIGVAVGYYFYNKNKTSSTASQALIPSTTPAPTTATLSGTGTTSSPQTTSAWQTSAAQQAIQAGYNPVAVDNALANWQNGTPLNTTQESILTWILSHVGNPPNGIQPIYTGTTSPTGTGTIPAPTIGTSSSPAPVASSPAPAAPSSPYTHIGTEQAGSVIAASGQTIYGEPQPGIYVPVVQNGQWTAAGNAYRNEANNPGLFTEAA